MDFYLGVLAGTQFDGDSYLVPAQFGVPMLSYNADLWAAAGLAPPERPLTWPQLIDAATALTRTRGTTVEIHGLADPNGGWPLWAEVKRNGGRIAATADGAATIDQPAVVQALTQVKQWVDGGVLLPFARDGSSDGDSFARRVAKQELAIWPAFATNHVEDTATWPFRVGTMAMPTSEQPDRRIPIGSIISSGTAHPDAAWRWLSYLSTQPAPFAFGGSQNSAVPARPSVAAASRYWEQLPEAVRVALQAAVDVAPEVLRASGYDGTAAQALDAALAAVLDGSQLPAEAARTAQAEYVAAIAALAQTPTPDPLANRFVIPTPEIDIAASTTSEIRISAVGLDTATLPALVTQFRATRPDIRVTILNEAAAASNDVDVFVSYGALSTEQQAQLLDLTPLLDQEPQPLRDDYPASAWDAARAGERIVGLPYTVSFPMLAFNPTLFANANLAEPTAAWTGEDIAMAAQTITRRDGANPPRVIITNKTFEAQAFLASFGVAPFMWDGATVVPDLREPFVRDALAQYAAILGAATPADTTVGYLRDGTTIGDAMLADRERIAAGEVAMWWANAPEGVLFDTPPGIEPKYVPIANVLRADTNLRYSQLHITRQAQDVDAAWQFITFLSAQPTTAAGRLPARATAANARELAGVIPADVLAAYRQVLRDRDPAARQGRTPLTDAEWYWIFRAIDSTVGKPPRELDTALEMAQQTMQQYRSCVRGGRSPAQCARDVDPEYMGTMQP